MLPFNEGDTPINSDTHSVIAALFADVSSFNSLRWSTDESDKTGAVMMALSRLAVNWKYLSDISKSAAFKNDFSAIILSSSLLASFTAPSFDSGSSRFNSQLKSSVVCVSLSDLTNSMDLMTDLNVASVIENIAPAR